MNQITHERSSELIPARSRGPRTQSCKRGILLRRRFEQTNCRDSRSFRNTSNPSGAVPIFRFVINYSRPHNVLMHNQGSSRREGYSFTVRLGLGKHTWPAQLHPPPNPQFWSLTALSSPLPTMGKLNPSFERSSSKPVIRVLASSCSTKSTRSFREGKKEREGK